MWDKRGLLGLAAATALTSVLGCSAGDVLGSSDDDFVDSCGSGYGDRVLEAARDGESTVPGDIEFRANRVVGKPLVGGRAIADKAVELISGAKHDVTIEFFDIDESSWMAKQMGEAISNLPRDVHVSVLVNPIPKKRFLVFPESAERTEERLRELFGDRPNVHVGAFDVKGFLGVLHTKLLIVDGERALVTDSNFQKQGDPVGEGGLGWFQLGMVVEGEVASGLRAEAVDAWRHSKEHYSPPELASDPRSAPACTRMIALGRAEGKGEDASANRGYAAFFRSARSKLKVITPNLNDSLALDALADATENADVYVVLSKGFNDATERIITQGGTNEKNAERLSGMAKNKCNLHIRWFADESGEAVDGNVQGASHAKWASVDGQAMVLGSQNLDTQSWKKSRELSLMVDDPATTSSFDEVFAEAWKRAEPAYECSSAK